LCEIAAPDQPEMLTRAALEFCLADAFHPGCEMTWVMRTPSLYMTPFRIAHAARGWQEPAYSAPLHYDDLTGLDNGPLNAQLPGGLTRWMAVPWQTDTASCGSGYDDTFSPYLPTFWPARVPNQVLTDENYKIVLEGQRPLGERLAAFANRVAWMSTLDNTSYNARINSLVDDISRVGVVEQRPGPAGDDFPPSMDVEDLPSHVTPPPLAQKLDLSTIQKVRRFPHGLRRDRAGD